MSLTITNKLLIINLVGAVLLLFVAAIYAPNSTEAREIDALLVKPFADSFKSLISTMTTGSSLELNVSGTDVAKNLVALSWQTGFPLTMPSGLGEKFSEFLHQLTDRINAAPTEDIARRGLQGMRNDTNDIIDAVVEEIRRSPDGLYTDLTLTKVNNMPLQDAMVGLGQQLKAFGSDLRYYQVIANQVLGIPVLSDVASAWVGVTDKLPDSLSMETINGNFKSVQSAASMSLNGITNNIPGFSTMSNLIRAK